MLNFELYSIYTSDNEYNGSDKELFMSYEEAYAARMNYANWWSEDGDIWIRHFDKNGRSMLEEWHINPEGRIVDHYDFSKKKKQTVKPVKRV